MVTALKLLQENWIGVGLAVAGNFVISVSYIVVKHAHNVNKQSLRPEVPYTRLPLWWLGMTLMWVGEIGNFGAYGFAPASLVAPLGSSSIVFNTILAVTFLGEELRKRDIVGVLLTVAGSMMVVGFAPTVRVLPQVVTDCTQDELTLNAAQLLEDILQPAFISYFSVAVVTSVVLAFYSSTYGPKYIMVNILICSLLGSISVLSAKAISMSIRLLFTGSNQFAYALPWIIAVLMLLCGILQMIYLNRAVEAFGALEVVPAYYTAFSLASIIGAVILYKELQNLEPYRIIGFSAGFLGVYLVNTFRPGTAGRESNQPYDRVAEGEKEHVDETQLEPLELEYGGDPEVQPSEADEELPWYSKAKKRMFG